MKISITSVMLLSLVVSLASAMELTSDNYHDATAGKPVFLKFFRPGQVYG
jgi:hypothetical protein